MELKPMEELQEHQLMDNAEKVIISMEHVEG